MNGYLIKIRLQEMHLLALLQQPRPVLLLHLLFLQHKHHISRRMMRLAVLGVDFGVKFEFYVVSCLLRIGVAGES